MGYGLGMIRSTGDGGRWVVSCAFRPIREEPYVVGGGVFKGLVDPGLLFELT